MRDRAEFSAPDAVIAKAAVDIVIREVCERYVSLSPAANSQIASIGT